MKRNAADGLLTKPSKVKVLITKTFTREPEE
jgi:hypothetical protein